MLITGNMLFAALSFTSLILLGIAHFGLAFAEPVLVDSDRYRLELFADLADFDGQPRAFQLTITDGENGFPAGMYITSGPVGGTESDRLFHVSIEGEVTVVKDGFNTIDSILFAKGPYGNGMLIAEPREMRILRLLSDNTITTFADVGDTPLGPAIMAYRDSDLYVTDFSSGNIVRVYPDGGSEVFATIPLTGLAPIEGLNAILDDSNGRYVQGFIVSTFTGGIDPSNAGAVYMVSEDGGEVTKLLDGLNGIELLTFGRGGFFGEELFIASQGTDLPEDGAVYYLSDQGTLVPFMENIDAIHVVFDSEEVLGGGMFVSEFPNGPFRGPHPAGKVWRITPVENVPSEFLEFTYQNEQFSINAELTNGSIDAVDIDPDFTSLILSVATSNENEGTLSITLPRKLIDAKVRGQDDAFIVLVDGEESSFRQVSANDLERSLVIDIPAGTQEIEIVGNQVIPEFYAVVLPIFATVLALAILIQRRNVIRL